MSASVQLRGGDKAKVQAQAQAGCITSIPSPIKPEPEMELAVVRHGNSNQANEAGATSLGSDRCIVLTPKWDHSKGNGEKKEGRKSVEKRRRRKG